LAGSCRSADLDGTAATVGVVEREPVVRNVRDCGFGSWSWARLRVATAVARELAGFVWAEMTA
jgi:hypothetical protein